MNICNLKTDGEQNQFLMDDKLFQLLNAVIVLFLKKVTV